jgi:hypothetical protein
MAAMLRVLSCATYETSIHRQPRHRRNCHHGTIGISASPCGSKIKRAD